MRFVKAYRTMAKVISGSVSFSHETGESIKAIRSLDIEIEDRLRVVYQAYRYVPM